MYFIARIKRVPGRFFVIQDGNVYEARKIHNAKRQEERYHNKPDSFTGLHLNEMTRYFDANEILSLKPFTPPGLSR